MSKKQDSDQDKNQNQNQDNNQQEQIYGAWNDPEAPPPPTGQQEQQQQQSEFLPGSSNQQSTMRNLGSNENSGQSQNRDTGSYYYQPTNFSLNQETGGRSQIQQYSMSNQSFNSQQQTRQTNQQQQFTSIFPINSPGIFNSQVPLGQFQPATSTNALLPQINPNPQFVQSTYYGYQQQQNPFMQVSQQQYQQPLPIRNPLPVIPNSFSNMIQPQRSIVPQQEQQQQQQLSNQQVSYPYSLFTTNEQVQQQQYQQQYQLQLFQQRQQQNYYYYQQLNSSMPLGGSQNAIPFQQPAVLNENYQSNAGIKSSEVDSSNVLMQNLGQQQPSQNVHPQEIRQERKIHKPIHKTKALKTERKKLTKQNKKGSLQQINPQFIYEILMQPQSDNLFNILDPYYIKNTNNAIQDVDNTSIIKFAVGSKFSIGVKLVNSKTRKIVKNTVPILVQLMVQDSQSPHEWIGQINQQGKRLNQLVNGYCVFEDISIDKLTSTKDDLEFRILIEAIREEDEKKQDADPHENVDGSTIAERVALRKKEEIKEIISKGIKSQPIEQEEGEIVNSPIDISQIKPLIIDQIQVKLRDRKNEKKKKHKPSDLK